MVDRLILFIKHINKSKRKAEVPLYQFYINMPKEDRLLIMVNNDKTSTVKAFDKEGNPKMSKDGK